jgi:hypothetical protein
LNFHHRAAAVKTEVLTSYHGGGTAAVRRAFDVDGGYVPKQGITDFVGLSEAGEVRQIEYRTLDIAFLQAVVDIGDDGGYGFIGTAVNLFVKGYHIKLIGLEECDEPFQ